MLPDINGDGYGDLLESDADGNWCDPDFDQDDFVGLRDFRYLRARFGTNDALADLNGDGIVDRDDFLIFRDYLGGPPGP